MMKSGFDLDEIERLISHGGAGVVVIDRDDLAAMIAAIRELRAENARLAGLSKHNNELARMRHAQANDFRAKYVSVTGDPS